MNNAKDRGAVLQFEIDRRRWLNTSGHDFSANSVGEKPGERLRHMVRTAAADTLANGGTFVLVVTPDKVTMIQRPDAEEI